MDNFHVKQSQTNVKFKNFLGGILYQSNTLKIIFPTKHFLGKSFPCKTFSFHPFSTLAIKHTLILFSNRSITESTLECPKAKTRLPAKDCTIMAISAPVRTQISLAFLKSPTRRLQKVTCLLLNFSIFFISIFLLPSVFFFSTTIFSQTIQ